MDILKQIETTLRAEYANGMTQQEIAAKHHVKHPQIQRILCGKRSVGGLTLETFCKMFPRATVNLEGQTVVAGNIADNVNTYAGSGNNFFTDRGNTDFKAKVLSTVIKLDLPPDAMQTVLRAIDAL